MAAFALIVSWLAVRSSSCGRGGKRSKYPKSLQHNPVLVAGFPEDFDDTGGFNEAFQASACLKGFLAAMRRHPKSRRAAIHEPRNRIESQESYYERRSLQGIRCRATRHRKTIATTFETAGPGASGAIGD